MRGQRAAPLSFWALLHREGGAGGAGPAGRPEDVCVAAAVPGVAGGLGKAVEASSVPRVHWSSQTRWHSEPGTRHLGDELLS